MTKPPREGHLHQLLLYETSQDLRAVVVPMLRRGLAAGEAVVLACGQANTELLARELAVAPSDRPAAGRLTVLNADDGGRPAVAVDLLRRLTRAYSAAEHGRILLVRETDLGAGLGAGPGRYAAAVEFEAAADVALAAEPLTSLCLYHRPNLPASLLTEVEHAHPRLLSATGSDGNPGYRSPATLLRRHATPGLDPLQTTPALYQHPPLTSLSEVSRLRRDLQDLIGTLPVPMATRNDFIAAVGEVTVNGLQHGRLPVRVLIWASADRLLATVTDAGRGFDDPLAGYLAPGEDLSGGAGLWLARLLCDRVEAVRAHESFTIRLATSLPASNGRPALNGVRARTEHARRRAQRARQRAEQLQGELDLLIGDFWRHPPRP
ncbi:Anti-sigma regulatory factor (Ser/Thr protein kinase) [Nonomuraea solani]|uniref:Anti-sigma regulatory factor (Ser/Thr protein kinase) n=1 Tax=Nonomuraea solani TaxID=1144553 RepID=A0A1H6BTX3_9ACTN|nr:MEDS domain-containing protein [Nonomuraea solani]SEG64113.1 Anti-sigma regulatory factor (Ser/Thr protein kinase) [Nonomuraea solani]